MKKQVEPIILTVALLLLGLGAALFAYLYPSVPVITGIPALSAQGKNVMPLKADDVAASLAVWASPTSWEEPPSHNRLFHSDKYLFFASIYPSGDYIKKLDAKTQLPSGMLISWCDAHHLDITDVNVDREDPDGDGFSNLTEYKNEPVGVRYDAHKLDGSQSTDPNDAKSHPSYLSRLRLQKYEQQPFHIYFNGYEQLNGVYMFQFHLPDEPSYSQPQLKKAGDPLGFGGYVIGPFHQEFRDVMNASTHQMEHTEDGFTTIELDQTETGEKVIVPFRTPNFNSPEVTADFVMLMSDDADKVIKVPVGKALSLSLFLPTLNGVFLVKEANDDGATIVQQSDGKSYHILKLEDAEWNEIPQPPAPKQP